MSNQTSARMLKQLTGGRNLGVQVEANRNIVCGYGYPENPEFADYLAIYRRVGPARAGCDKPVNSTWSDWPTIRDVTNFTPDGQPKYNDKVKTRFELQFELLMKNHKLALKNRIKSLDRKQRVGQYAASLIVARDNSGAEMNKPLKSLLPGQLVKLVPLYEDQVVESQWDTNATSATYGEPTMYSIREFASSSKSQGQNRSFECHPSRLIMAAEGAEDGTIYGTPAMQGCFYALMDWEKIRMSAAEGAKKNADQRNVMAMKDGSSAPKPGTPAFDRMDDDIYDFDTGKLSTLLVTEATLSSLQSNMGDPTKSAELCEKEISANFDMPMTELFGYQTGKLASEKDGDKYKTSIHDRRTGFGTELIMEHLNRFVELGLLPKPNGEIVIDWPDAREPSQADKLSMGEQAARIRKEIFATGGDAAAVIPDSFFTDLLGIDIVADSDLDEEDDEPVED